MANKLFVSTKDEYPKMFENAFLDFFSRVPFYVPLLIFIPIISYYSYLSFEEAGISVIAFTVGERFGVRFTEIVDPEKRVENL